MTAPTATAPLCGHTWWAGAPCLCLRDWHTRVLHTLHLCSLPAEHTTDPGPVPRPHYCRCGTTTERRPTP